MIKLSYVKALQRLRKKAAKVPVLNFPDLVGLLLSSKFIRKVPLTGTTRIQTALQDNYDVKNNILKVLQETSPTLHNKDSLQDLSKQVISNVGISKADNEAITKALNDIPQDYTEFPIKFYDRRDDLLIKLLNLYGKYDISPIFNSIRGQARLKKPSIDTRRNFRYNLIIGFTYKNPLDKSKHLFLDPYINPYSIDDDYINPILKATIDAGLGQRGIRLPRISKDLPELSLYFLYPLNLKLFKENLLNFKKAEKKDYNLLYEGTPGDTWRYSTHSNPSFRTYPGGITAVVPASGYYNLTKIFPELNTYFKTKGKENVIFDNIEDINNKLQTWNKILAYDTPYIKFPKGSGLPLIEGTKNTYLSRLDQIYN